MEKWNNIWQNKKNKVKLIREYKDRDFSSSIANTEKYKEM